MALPLPFSKAILQFNQVSLHAGDEKRWKSFKFWMCPFNAGSHRVSTPLPAFSKKFCWSGGELWVKCVAEKWWGTIFTLNLSLSGKLVPSLTDTINFKLYLHYQVYACGDFFLSLSFLCLNLDPEKSAMSAYPEFKPTAANRPPFIHFKWRAELIKKYSLMAQINEHAINKCFIK